MTQSDGSAGNRTGEEDAVLFYLLHLAFLHIRAAEDLETAQSIAHVFHNIPMKMFRDVSFDDLKKELRSQSEWINISGTVAAMLGDARKYAKPK